MAETATQTAGVKKTTRTRKPGGPAKKKPNKKLLIGGAALGGLLLLSHKGSGGTNAQQTDALATGELDAYQQGIQDAGQLAGLDSGAVGVQGASGGSGSSGGGSGDGSAITGGVGDATGLAPIPITDGGKKIKPVRKPPGHHKHPHKPPKGHNKSHKKHKGPGEKSAVQHHDSEHKERPKPAEPHRAKPAPANHRGQHPNTHRRSRRGHRRGSEVEVESPEGQGYGITVFGRTFPGAIGFRNGPPRSIPGAGVVRDVTVIYGGHNETHTFGLNSGHWHDHTRGRNPLQGRPVPRLVTTSELG